MSLPGFSVRIAAGTIPVVRLHYSANPAKRPGTPAGDAWLQAASAGYPGGTQSPRWRKEQEIEYDALSGEALFPLWETVLRPAVTVAPFRPDATWRLYGSYDHGWRRPGCYLVHGVSPLGEKVTLWEAYAAKVPVAAWARVIRGEAVLLGDGRHLPGNPFAGQEVWRRADPAIWHEDQQTDAEFKSVGALFRRAGVLFLPADRGGDLTVAGWLLGTEWADPTAPRYRITTDCPQLLRELGGLRHKDWSPHVAQTRGDPEALVDKDDHAWDALKYFLQAFPPAPPGARPAVAPGGSFGWWRQQAERDRKGQPVQSYQRAMVR